MEVVMKISSINSPNFCSKAKIIRQLDDINRQFIKKFDDIPSPSKIMAKIDIYHNKDSKKYIPLEWRNVCKKYIEKLKIMRADLDDATNHEEILRIVQKHKVANCGELTDILQAELRQKGYKTEKVNLIIRSLSATKRQAKDHCFILVNPKKKIDFYNPSTWGSKSIVVDPWLGFVSRKDDAISKYTSFYDLMDDEFFIYTST